LTGVAVYDDAQRHTNMRTRAPRLGVHQVVKQHWHKAARGSAGKAGAQRRDAVCARTFSIVSFTVISYSKLSSDLTVENFGVEGRDAVWA